MLIKIYKKGGSLLDYIKLQQKSIEGFNERKIA